MREKLIESRIVVLPFIRFILGLKLPKTKKFEIWQYECIVLFSENKKEMNFPAEFSSLLFKIRLTHTDRDHTLQRYPTFFF